MSYVLAIDVGTSFTAAAVLRPGQGPNAVPEILPLGLHGSAVPSVLYYADDGRVLVGEAAERRGLDDPKRVVREFKRRIGDSVPLAVGDGWLAPEDVFAAMAAWVVDKAAEREGSTATSIVMTHPAAWGRHRTSRVLAALNAAGLAEVTLISEPEAAALHYASQTKVEDGSTIAVYDLGGGTFDTAILRKAGAGNFELLGHPDGLETLGGADFDAAVLRYAASHLGEVLTGLDAADPATLAALARLRRECREAKEVLSLDSEASISVSLPGTQQSIRLVRAEFESLIESHLRETVDALERSLQSVELEPEDLDAVLLIGGSSRIPLVAELISAELGRPIAVDADPKSSICLGAAVSALPAVLPVPDEAGRTVASVAADGAAGVVTQGASPRAGVVHRRPALSALRTAAVGNQGVQAGRHAPRTRVRMTAAAAAAATLLTVVTATAAQSPGGKDLLSAFAAQTTDVMRDGGGQAAPGPGSGAGDGGAGSVAAGGQPVAGLDASARTGTSRTSTGTGQSGRKGSQAPGGSGSAAVPGTGGVAPGAALPGSAAPGASNPGAAPGASNPGAAPGTSNPGTSNPGASTPPATSPGGAASGPTPDPSTPPPVVQPTTPPVVTPTTPADPPATVPDPVTPAPQPTTQAPPPPPPATQDPAPIPSDPVTEPAPAPPPPETTPSQEPAPATVV